MMTEEDKKLVLATYQRVEEGAKKTRAFIRDLVKDLPPEHQWIVYSRILNLTMCCHYTLTVEAIDRANEGKPDERNETDNLSKSDSCL